MAFLAKHPARNILLTLVGLALFWALINAPVMLTLWRHGFDDGTYSHSYLIPFIFVYLLVVLARRGELHPRQSVYLPAVLAFIICAVGFYFALTAQLSLLYWIFSLLLLASACWIVVHYTLGLAYAIGFLLFMYPMWGALQYVLQHLSVFAVMNLMNLTGIPTYVEETSVMIPEGTFVIAGGCSGLRYFIVSLAIGSMFVFLNLRSRVSVVKFMALAIIGALITNWIRIVALVLIGHFTEMQSDLMHDHNNFGWYIYAPFIILLFWYGEKLIKQEPADVLQKQEEAAALKTYRQYTPNAIIACCLIVLSSSVLQLNVLTSPIDTDNCNQHQLESEYAPYLPYGPTICTMQQRAGSIAYHTLSALYNGDDPDGKPTQYQVHLAPESWQELRRLENGSWTIRIFRNGREQHFIAYSYITPTEQVASETAMKKARISSALKGERRSGLLWAHAQCPNNCDAVIQQWPAVSQAFSFQQF